LVISLPVTADLTTSAYLPTLRLPRTPPLCPLPTRAARRESPEVGERARHSPAGAPAAQDREPLAEEPITRSSAIRDGRPGLCSRSAVRWGDCGWARSQARARGPGLRPSPAGCITSIAERAAGGDLTRQFVGLRAGARLALGRRVPLRWLIWMLLAACRGQAMEAGESAKPSRKLRYRTGRQIRGPGAGILSVA
jgi:hypothetical protein